MADEFAAAPVNPSADRTKRKNRLNTSYSHLPDGPRKRKAQKVKSDLIRSAKIKKDYAKIQQRQDVPVQPASMGIHPERQAAMDEPSENEDRPVELKPQKRSRNKPTPFQKESTLAQRRNEERERKRREIEEVEAQKAIRRGEREKFLKSLQKARRPDRKGQRKLGRESKLLPRMVEGLFHRLEREKLGSEAVL